MAVKKRAVWFSDEEWTLLSARARDHSKTISAYIRCAVIEQAVVHPGWHKTIGGEKESAK